MFGFTFQDVAREFPQKNHVHLARILAEMVEKRDGRRVPMNKKYPGAITILFLLMRIRKPMFLMDIKRHRTKEEIWLENQCGSHPH